MSEEVERGLDRLTIRVVDPFTDEVLDSRTIYDDYCLVTAGHCEMSSVRSYANGTHVIVVKHARDRKDYPRDRKIAEIESDREG